MLTFEFLETERLIIEPLTQNDSLFMLELLNTDGWLRFIGDRNVRTQEDAEAYIQKIKANQNYAYHVFKLKTTKEPLGVVTFIQRDNQKSPDIGFALLPSYEKQGYAYEASKKHLDAILATNLFDEIIGITLVNNTKSIALLEKLGLNFQYSYSNENEELALYSLKNIR